MSQQLKDDPDRLSMDDVDDDDDDTMYTSTRRGVLLEIQVRI